MYLAILNATEQRYDFVTGGLVDPIEPHGFGVADDSFPIIRRAIEAGSFLPVTEMATDPLAQAALDLAAEMNATGVPSTRIPTILEQVRAAILLDVSGLTDIAAAQGVTLEALISAVGAIPDPQTLVTDTDLAVEADVRQTADVTEAGQRQSADAMLTPLEEHGGTVGLVVFDSDGLAIEIATHWGISATAGVYYEEDPADVTPGEEAILGIDPDTGIYWTLLSEVH